MAGMVVAHLFLLYLQMVVGSSNDTCAALDDSSPFLVTLVVSATLSALLLSAGIVLVVLAWRVQKKRMDVIKEHMNEVLDLVISDIFPGKVADQLIALSTQKTTGGASATVSDKEGPTGPTPSKPTPAPQASAPTPQGGGEDLYDNIN